VKPSKQSPELDSQLLLAARKGSLSRVSLLIKAGADLEARNRDGWTPLLVSVRRGHTEIASLLLKAGANVNAKTGSGWTALHLAAKNGLEDLTRQLLRLNLVVAAIALWKTVWLIVIFRPLLFLLIPVRLVFGVLLVPPVITEVGMQNPKRRF